MCVIQKLNCPSQDQFLTTPDEYDRGKNRRKTTIKLRHTHGFSAVLLRRTQNP